VTRKESSLLISQESLENFAEWNAFANENYAGKIKKILSELCI